MGAPAGAMAWVDEHAIPIIEQPSDLCFCGWPWFGWASGQQSCAEAATGCACCIGQSCAANADEMPLAARAKAVRRESHTRRMRPGYWGRLSNWSTRRTSVATN